jgi:hypothetical protein
VKRGVILLLVLFTGIVLFLAYRWYDRFPWLKAAVRMHSERGSADCGQLTNASDGPHLDPDVVLDCVRVARQQHRPFVVMFTVHGIDETFSNAIVGDSKGRAVEILYGMGMADNPNKLFRHACDSSRPFLLEQSSIPRLHCQPWPPQQ